MKKTKKKIIKAPVTISPRKRIRAFVFVFKHLPGDPHYISLGLAIGVFIGSTPTVPFHMIMAIICAFFLKASKPAATIGVWFSNPLTIPLFYIAAYKLGVFLCGESTRDMEQLTALIQTLDGPFSLQVKFDSILHFLKLELHTFYIMMLGGLVIGTVLGILSYFITFKIIVRMRSEEEIT